MTKKEANEVMADWLKKALDPDGILIEDPRFSPGWTEEQVIMFEALELMDES
jgi:hypothetical protein